MRMAALHNSTASKHSTEDGESGASALTAEEAVGRSAMLISFFVIISRITGFMRTWAMAFALGSTMLASSYQVANNLPNMLYELVMGGMLVTAFLPVYMSVKQKLGARGGAAYASNLISITFVLLGAVALACTIFAPALIFTQSFMSDQETVEDAVFFFRFFAIQIVFYGISSIVSGLLNASRDYLWSSAAPIFNNIIVTLTFVAYAFVAPLDADAAKLIIAIGNPLGVFIQMAIQLPALKRNGIHLRFRINLKDPALMETLSIGIPAVIVMFAGLIIVSVQNAAAYASADNGPSVIAYARLWFTLPYAFLTVPITTALFTEISDMVAQGNMSGFKKGLTKGINQIIFLMVPFAMYLIVFSIPLVTLYHIGAFSEENIHQIATYLAILSVSLPFYAVNTYLQKAFSALRKMKHFAIMVAGGAIVQIAFTLIFATEMGGALGIFGLAAVAFGFSALRKMKHFAIMVAGGAIVQIAFTLIFATEMGGALGIFGLAAVAFGETVYYALVDIIGILYLRSNLGPLGIKSTVKAALRALILGIAGAGAAAVLIYILAPAFLPLDGSIGNALILIIIGGLLALAVTFGPACALDFPEASMFTRILRKFTDRKINEKVGKAKHARR